MHRAQRFLATKIFIHYNGRNANKLDHQTFEKYGKGKTNIMSINQTVNGGVAHSKNPRKCAYHVTFDLDLDLEHTLNAS